VVGSLKAILFIYLLQFYFVSNVDTMQKRLIRMSIMTSCNYMIISNYNDTFLCDRNEYRKLENKK
jgi:hypothetical protein